MSTAARALLEGAAPVIGDFPAAGGTARIVLETSFEVVGGDVAYSANGSLHVGGPGIAGGLPAVMLHLTGPGGTSVAFRRVQYPQPPSTLIANGSSPRASTT
jgi:hypothetical protein